MTQIFDNSLIYPISRRPWSLLIIVCMLFALSACSRNPGPAPERNPQLSPLARSTNAIALALLAATVESPGNTNTVISPLSITRQLSLLGNGTSDPLSAALLDKLALGSDWNTMNSIQEPWHDAMSAFSDVKVISASSIWKKPGMELTGKFQALTKQYQTEMKPLSTDPAQSAVQVAAWVKEKTKGMVNHTPNLGKVDLLLAETLYFSGKWLYPFAPDETRNGQFTAADGSTETVPMMQWSSEEEVPYYDTKFGQVLLLPYGRRGDAHMKLVLPPEGVSLKTTLESLAPEVLAEFTSVTTDTLRKGSVVIPRLQLSGKMNLLERSDPLQLREKFLAADYSQISPQLAGGLPLSIQQFSVIEIDEQGTKAGLFAATHLEGSLLNFHFHANRPFLLFIEDYNGVIHFAAAVNTTKAN